DNHIADESWASGGNGTAPDIMFPRAKIYGACMACHKPEQVFVKNEKHQPVWWTIAYQERVCTDCHGQHRMVSRKCKWK
ncbi:MAG: cytochrome c3 family protein, partial [Verrucomicrobia bacterium]|nr:cytochrome c3 family protein [Verrucomicrobiota bacterium]